MEGYKDELKHVFKSTPTQSQPIIFASSDNLNVGDNVGDYAYNRTRSFSDEKVGVLKREGKDNDGVWHVIEFLKNKLWKDY